MARTGTEYKYEYDSSEFAESCQHLFEKHFHEDVIIPEELHNSVISRLLSFTLNSKEPKSLYHALRFDYLHSFFSEVKKIRKIKGLPKGRPKRFIPTKIPKRLVIIVVRVSTNDDGNKLVPISVKSKGRTVKMKTAVNRKTGKIRSNRYAVNFVNDNFDIQLLSEFKLERDQKKLIYYAYNEIRILVKCIYKRLESSLDYSTKIYECEPKKKELYEWIAIALNWRLNTELELWKQYQKLWWGNDEIFPTILPEPKFNSRNIRDFLEH